MMKTLSVGFLLPLALVSCAVLEKRTPAESDLKEFQEAIKVSPYLMSKKGYRHLAATGFPLPGFKGKATKPQSLVPELSEIGPSPMFPGSLRRTVRYGPYLLPSPGKKNWESRLLKVSGMTDTMETNAKKPCEECVILSSVLELQGADGKPVKDAWLHHSGVIMRGAGLQDSMCGVHGFQALFEQGNEKVEIPSVDPLSGVKVGYHIKPHYKFVLSNELVNMNQEAQWVWSAITYDFVEGEQPDFKNAKSLLLTVGALPICTKLKNTHGASNLTIAGTPKSNVFSEHSVPWVAPYDGVIIGAGGHLHDGGLGVDVYQNDKLICNSEAKYSVGAGSDDGHGMGSKGSYDPKASHIASMSVCMVNSPIKKGDTLSLTAHYDFNKYPGMKNNKGTLDEVMGMAGIFIAA